jgi:hypothetical protein
MSRRTRNRRLPDAVGLEHRRVNPAGVVAIVLVVLSGAAISIVITLLVPILVSAIFGHPA